MMMYRLLSVTSHTNCIVARWPDKRCLSHSMCLYQVIMPWWPDKGTCCEIVALLEWRRQWHWIDTKLDNDIIIASLKSESIYCKLINRIPGSHLKKIKFTRLDFENACLIAQQASRCQQTFSKPCLVNLITKDTHLVFSI